MDSNLAQASGRSRWRIWAPVAALVAVGAAWVVGGGERELSATPPPGCSNGELDEDGDGLSVSQERVLYSSDLRADSDFDGFSDVEEVARHTSPLFASSAPSSTSRAISVGMTAHGGMGQVHVMVALYTPDANLRTKRVRIGVQSGRSVAYLSNHFVAQHSTASYFAARDTPGVVTLLDVAVDPQFVQLGHALTFFVVAGELGLPPISASTVRLYNIGGMVTIAEPNPRVDPSSAPGTIYVPLPVGGSGSGGSASIPSTWSSGEICVQQSAPVGVSGALVTQEITSASCMNGWDGYCAPNCSSGVGSTYTTVDPVVLIGG